MLRIATAEYFESLEHFLQHLPVGRDPELILLKGHLLVERLLEKYLAANLANPSALTDGEFSFSQKLAVVAALSCKSDSEWLWVTIKLFNRLRNRLAHRLDNVGYSSLLEEFLLQVEASPELPHLDPPKEITERLHRAVFAVHEALSHRVNL
jgi:hypothetical protein